MADLRMYPVHDPDELLPDPEKYTPLLEYRIPGTLPRDGRFIAFHEGDDPVVNGWFARPADGAECKPNRFAIVPPILKNEKEEKKESVWISSNKSIFLDALAHPKLVSRFQRDEFFEWICKMTRYRDYMFVTINRLYALPDEDIDPRNKDENNNDDGVFALAGAWERRRSERQRRRGQRKTERDSLLAEKTYGLPSNRERATLKPPSKEAVPCGSLVVLYANDERYADSVRSGSSEDIFVATSAFEAWENRIRFSLQNSLSKGGYYDFPLLSEPPDVFTEAPLARPLDERNDVQFRLKLYDFQSRTVHWMKRIEEDDSGEQQRLYLKSDREEWLRTFHTNIGFSSNQARTPQLVISEQDPCFPRHLAYEKTVNRQVLPPSVLQEYLPGLNHHDWPQQKNSLSSSQTSSIGEFSTLLPLDRMRKTRKKNEVRVRGGVICDATGTGKTIETIGLIALQHANDRQRILASDTRDYTGIPRWRHPWVNVDTGPFYYCSATLVIAPKQVCKQWVEQFAKASGPKAFRILLIMTSKDASNTSMCDVLRHYDVVIINKDVFQMQNYRTIHVKWSPQVEERLGWEEERDYSPKETKPYQVSRRYYELKTDYAQQKDHPMNKALAVLLKLNREATRKAPDLVPPGSFFPHFHAGLCTWRRVIIDEVHELDDRWRLIERAVCSIRSLTRWGATASPGFNKSASFSPNQGGYLALCRVNKNKRQYFMKPCNRWQFVQHFTRRSGFSGMPKLHVHRVDVNMTPQEMAIYQSLDGIGPRTLLEFCCHHDISSDLWLRSFLPSRIYQRQVGGNSDEEGFESIVPHTVKEVADAMQSARLSRIKQVTERTLVQRRDWQAGEDKMIALLEEFFPAFASQYRSTCWWLRDYLLECSNNNNSSSSSSNSTLNASKGVDDGISLQEKQHIKNRLKIRRQILNLTEGPTLKRARVGEPDANEKEEKEEKEEKDDDVGMEPMNTAPDDDEKKEKEKPHSPNKKKQPKGKRKVDFKNQFEQLFEKQTHLYRSLHRELDALNTVQRQHSYYESIFQLLTNEGDIECPICLCEIPPNETVLTACGHQFCMECINADGHNRVRSERMRLQGLVARGRDIGEEMRIRCATCRKSLRVLHDVKVIDRTANEDRPCVEKAVEKKEEEVEKKETVEKGEKDYSQFGSKIQKILEEIWSIQERPDAKKIIVFAQSRHLLHLIGDALVSFGLPFVYVEGKYAQRNIDLFRCDEKVRVILLSSERRGLRSTISGLDLPEANYIIAAHPPFGDDEDCYQQMKQAIGRIRRIGQTSECHMVVMVTRNTVEETLYEQWRTYATKRNEECGEF